MRDNPTAAARKTRHCPRCGRRPLEACSHEGREIDVCPKCGGLWCEAKNWDSEALGVFPTPGVASRRPRFKMDDPHTGEAAPSTQSAPERPKVEARPCRDRVCPKCKRPLTAIRVGGPEGCELDQCDRCGGVWFDRGEWEHLECLQTFQAYQQDLQRPTSWAEWSFQFFLRLPIEFNVAVRRFPMVTVVMITFCVIIFLAQLAVGQDHWQVFATYSTRIWHGQGLYALITSNFLHGGVLHLAGNMYFLYILGDNVEDALGRWRYTLLFLGSAVASDLMHVVVFPNSNVPLLGASGGVLGVMAAYLLLFPRARLTIMLVFWQFKVKSWVWVGFYLLVQVVGAILTLPGQPGEVAYWGHLGGFIAGVLFVWPQRHALVEKHPLLRLLHHYRAPANRSRASTVESS